MKEGSQQPDQRNSATLFSGVQHFPLYFISLAFLGLFPVLFHYDSISFVKLYQLALTGAVPHPLPMSFPASLLLILAPSGILHQDLCVLVFILPSSLGCTCHSPSRSRWLSS
ncbi:hypothetical protein LMH87_004951 [Akanthomyces muscarius]|uniref:Uncharacterized protein n=1 Tax=Akanthomyces muscarius TaxID=2231603 RepID=A0A9W8URG4_AKAMU|nr:hypothetical protein LMH87_004951 [Akanthomyces muscarius]KAJ4163208.1 hypothetical protein LMH87_004951 [Akanthomyces muscarius]